MRINVYAEEITAEVQIQTKTSDNGNEFKAIRFMLESSEKLHFRDDDDDRSAVTFWIPGSKDKGYKKELLIQAFEQAIEILENL